MTFASSASGRGMVLFGSGPERAGLVETATQDRGAGSQMHTVTVSGNDLPGTVGNNGIVPRTAYWFEALTLAKSGTEIDNNHGSCYSIAVLGT